MNSGFDGERRGLCIVTFGIVAWAAMVLGATPVSGAAEERLFTPDEEHRVVTRWNPSQPVNTPQSLRAQLAILGVLFEERAITSKVYEDETAFVKEQAREATLKAGLLPAAEPRRDPAYYQGAIDALTELLKSGKIPADVYESQLAVFSQRRQGRANIDQIRGQSETLIRLYHTGKIDTETFLKHYLPIWDEWYHIDNILSNGDFEVVEDRIADSRLAAVADWRGVIFDWGDSGQSRAEIDRKVRHRGRQSLRFSAQPGPSNLAWMSSPFLCERDDSVKVRLWVKAEGLKRGHLGRAASLHFFKSDGMVLWLHIPEGTYDWTMVEARLNAFGNIPERRVEQCRLEIQFYGEGILWVDDVVVVPTTRRERRQETSPRP